MVLPSDVLWQHMDLGIRLEDATACKLLNGTVGPRARVNADVSTIVRSHLKVAYPFHVSSKIVEHLERFVARQPESITLAEAPPPTAAGFCVLDEPLCLHLGPVLIHAGSGHPDDAVDGRQPWDR